MRKTIKQLQGESDYWRVKFINEQQRAEAAEAKQVPDGWEVCSPGWIERNGPCSCGAAPRIAFGDIGPHYHPKSVTRPAPAVSLAELVPTVCDGKEQEAFEEYARSKGLDLSQHPLHYLFLDGKTNQARSAWRECLVYVRAAILRNIEESK